MNRLVAATAALALSLGTIGAVDLSAAGAAHAVHAKKKAGCVTHKEFRRIKKGMRRHKVERIFGDHKSWGVSGGAGGYVLSYQSCDKQHAAFVEYVGIWSKSKHKYVGAKFDGFKRWTLAG